MTARVILCWLLPRRAGPTVAAALLFWPGAGSARPAERDLPGLSRGGMAVVATVRSGDTAQLRGGDRLRLAGVQAPRMARTPRPGAGQAGSRSWPLAAAARDAFAALTAGKSVTLFHGERRDDRYGRLIAHVVTADGVWVQGRLLRQGWVRVTPYDGDLALARRMLKLEAAARAARRGIWAHPFYRVRRYREGREFALRRHLDSFQIVRGRIVGIGRTRRRLYLNFGRNWRRDFTVSLDRRAACRFARAGLALDRLAGREVRVRGWLYWRNGPMIRVSRPAQIEVLDPPPRSGRP